MKKRPSPLQRNSDDERDAPPGHEHGSSSPSAPKPRKPRARKPVASTTHDLSPEPVKKDKPVNSQLQLSNPSPEGDDREESDVQVTLPKPAAKKKPPSSRKEKATRPKEKVSTTTAPSQEEKTLVKHADAVAPTKPKKKVNLGGGRGLLGGIGGIGASSINWGGEMGGSNVYGIPLTLSSPIKGGRDEEVKALQGSMFTFGANR